MKLLEMTQDEYRNGYKERLTASDCKMLLDNPYAYKIGHKIEGNEVALRQGSLIHSLILEPEKVEAEYLVTEECDKRTKSGKEQWAEYELQAQEQGKRLIPAIEYNSCNEIANAVLSTGVGALFKNGFSERSILGEVFGRPCKGRPDYIIPSENPEERLIIDLKTTTQGGSKKLAFQKSMERYKYYLQAKFYMELLQTQKFLFVVVEKEAPYNVAVFELDSYALEAGEAMIKEAFKIYDNLDWYERCYKDENNNYIQTLSLPQSFYYQNEDILKNLRG